MVNADNSRFPLIEMGLSRVELKPLANGKQVVVGDGDLYHPDKGHISVKSLIKVIDDAKQVSGNPLVAESIALARIKDLIKGTGFSEEEIVVAMEALYSEE